MNKQYHFWFLIIIFLFSACAESELISPTVSNGSFEEALKSHLLYVKNEVSQIIDPETGRPVSIPHLDLIYKTAGNITSSEDPETDLAIAYSLLGRAGDVDCKVPNPKTPLRFPRDHHINPDTGFEWYYLGIYLNVIDPEGVKGRIGIVLSIQKQRVIGLTTQKQYGLSDENCMMFVNLVTATVDLPEDHKIIRRNKNFQLPALGGSGGYSSKGEAFYMACGPDTISGSMNVLPLTTHVQDGE
ncbi:MAG: hypothetical protein KAT14_08060, partial [Candidatus Marinimicrobia bacterium]|nr:hypothetical protein [Candidatus Neomarinimicrobiota bacterium]